MQLFRDVMVVLATQGWEKILQDEQNDVVDIEDAGDDGNDDSRSDSLDAVDRLANHFKVPLETAGADINEIREEFKSMIEYAIQFISLSTMDYKSAWWRLFNCPNSSEWQNALLLAKVLFSLPASNGKLERAFSQVNLIKTSKRSSLSQSSLSNLVALNVDKTPLEDFSADSSIDLWWKGKQRRPSHAPRKHYKKRSSKRKEVTADSLGYQSSSTSAVILTQPEDDVVIVDDDDEAEEVEYYGDEEEDDEQGKFLLDNWDDWVL